MPNFLKQRLFITPWYAHECAYQGIINNRFCRKSQESFCFQVLIKYSSERTNALIFRRQEWFWVSGFGNCICISSWNLESKEFYFKYLCGFWKAHMAQLLLFKKIQSMQKMLGKKKLSWGGSICQTHMIACLMNLRNLCLGSVPFTRYKSCIFLLEEFLHSFYVTLPCLCKQDKRVNFFMYFSYILLDLWMMGVCSIVFVFSKKKKKTQKKQVLFLKSAFDFMEEFILGVKLWCAQNRYNAVKIDLNYPASNLEFCCVWLWWTKFNWKGKQNTGSDFSE